MQANTQLMSDIVLVRETTVDCLACIGTSESELGVRDVRVHDRPGLRPGFESESLGYCLDVAIILRTPGKKLEREDILQFGNIHGEIAEDFPQSGCLWFADLIDDNGDIIIEPGRRKFLLFRNQGNC